MFIGGENIGGSRKEILTLSYIFSEKIIFFSQMALFMSQFLNIPRSLYILFEKSCGVLGEHSDSKISFVSSILNFTDETGHRDK